MTLAYDGTAYAGWQVQPGSADDPGHVGGGLAAHRRPAVRVIASGRTDAGVHALAQVAGFRCDTRLSPDVLRRAINANMPDDIYVSELCCGTRRVPRHSRRGGQALPLRDPGRAAAGRVLPLHGLAHAGVLDVPLMQAAASTWSGSTIFGVSRRPVRRAGPASAPFMRSGSNVLPATNCSRWPSRWRRTGSCTTWCATSWGRWSLVGRGERPPDWIADVLAAQDRAQAGPTAPACGLMLVCVRYEGRVGF